LAECLLLSACLKKQMHANCQLKAFLSVKFILDLADCRGNATFAELPAKWHHRCLPTMLNKILKFFRPTESLSGKTPDLRKLSKPIIFTHIPKTAGTSFSNYIIGHLKNSSLAAPPFALIYPEGKPFGALSPDPFESNTYRFIHGHLMLQHVPANFDCYLTTFLRHPVSRVISQYQSWHNPANIMEPWKSRLCDSMREALEFSHQATLQDFVLSDNKIIQGSITNVQSIFLATAVNGELALSSAIENALTKYYFIGVVEHFDSAIASFRSKFCNSMEYNVDINQENRSKQAITAVSSKVMDRIMACNEHDFALYNEVCLSLGLSNKSKIAA